MNTFHNFYLMTSTDHAFQDLVTVTNSLWLWALSAVTGADESWSKMLTWSTHEYVNCHAQHGSDNTGQSLPVQKSQLMTQSHSPAICREAPSLCPQVLFPVWRWCLRFHPGCSPLWCTSPRCEQNKVYNYTAMCSYRHNLQTAMLSDLVTEENGYLRATPTGVKAWHRRLVCSNGPMETRQDGTQEL